MKVGIIWCQQTDILPNRCQVSKKSNTKLKRQKNQNKLRTRKTVIPLNFSFAKLDIQEKMFNKYNQS